MKPNNIQYILSFQQTSIKFGFHNHHFIPSDGLTQLYIRFIYHNNEPYILLKLDI